MSLTVECDNLPARSLTSMLGQGGKPETAEELGQSRHKGKSHVSVICTALDVSDRRAAAWVGLALGLGPGDQAAHPPAPT